MQCRPAIATLSSRKWGYLFEREKCYTPGWRGIGASCSAGWVYSWAVRTQLVIARLVLAVSMFAVALGSVRSPRA
jgi:hypothetical protein